MQDFFLLSHSFTETWGFESLHPMDNDALQKYTKQSAEQLRHSALTADGCNALNAWDIGLGFLPPSTLDEFQEHAEALQQCLKEHVKKIYWQDLTCAKLPPALAIVLYDSAVHLGSEAAVRLLQQSCNVVGDAHLDIFSPIQEDGLMRPNLMRLAADLKEHNLDFYTARLFVRQRVRYYAQYIQKRALQETGLSIWKERCQALLEQLALMERESY